MANKTPLSVKINSLGVDQLTSFRMKTPTETDEGTCYLGDDMWLNEGDTICLNDEVWVCQADGSLEKKEEESQNMALQNVTHRPRLQTGTARRAALKNEICLCFASECWYTKTQCEPTWPAF